VALSIAAGELGLAHTDRTALQSLLAARGSGASLPDRGAARALRLSLLGRIRDGRLATLRARQRLLHRDRPSQAHRLLRHSAAAARSSRNRGGARPRARTLSPAAHPPSAARLSRSRVGIARAVRLVQRLSRLLCRARRADALRARRPAAARTGRPRSDVLRRPARG